MKALCIAHRGCHHKCYENTKDAFLYAAKGDYYGIETDIHLTRDKKWIIHHDPTFKSNGKECVIKDEKLETLLKLPLDNKWNYQAYMLTLEEYLEIVKGSGKRPIIEIKPKNPSFFSLRKAVKIIRKYFSLDEVDFIAFYPWPLFKLKFMYRKEVHIQQLWEHTHPFIKKWAYKHNFGLDAEANCLTKEIVDEFHNKGLKVNAWTVDDKKTLKQLEDIGVDYITTNKFDQNS